MDLWDGSRSPIRRLMGRESASELEDSGTHPSSIQALNEIRPLFLATLIVVHLGIGSTLLLRSDHLFGSDGAVRYTQIAAQQGVPYRDFDVEMAPLDTVVIKLVAGNSALTTYRRVVALAILADLACAATLAYGWGGHVAIRYLSLTTPILLLGYLGTDFLWLTLTTFGCALVRRDRQRSGGAILALAALGRIWPLVLVPVLLASHGRRALVWFLMIVGIGVGAWFAVGGIDGPIQVASFRGARGWEFESLVGALVWIISRQPTVLEQGAPRVGLVTTAERFTLTAALVVGLILILRRAKQWSGDAFGLPALVSVALLLSVSPIFSLEYAAWLIPWASISGSERLGKPYVVGVAAITCITGVLAVLYTGFAVQNVSQVLLVARNGLCLAIVIGWLIDRRQADLAVVGSGRAIPDRVSAGD